LNTWYVDLKKFDSLQDRLSKELYIAIHNLFSLVKSESVSTIIPQYSVLKKDIKRFEEIANSSLYLKYANSLQLLEESNKIALVKKDIQVNALKVYNKYANHIDLKSMSISFLKFGKKAIDLVSNNITSIIGDYLIDALQQSTSNKRKVYFYNCTDSFYPILYANRIGELQRIVGAEKVSELLKSYQKGKETNP
jgi:hypothetical protein